MDDLQTPRLILKPLAIEDADAIQRLFAHWEVVQHLTTVRLNDYRLKGGRLRARLKVADRAACVR